MASSLYENGWSTITLCVLLGENLSGTNQRQFFALENVPMLFSALFLSFPIKMFFLISLQCLSCAILCLLLWVTQPCPRPYYNLTSHAPKCSNLISSAVWRADNTTCITCCPQTLLPLQLLPSIGLCQCQVLTICYASLSLYIISSVVRIVSWFLFRVIMVSYN